MDFEAGNFIGKYKKRILRNIKKYNAEIVINTDSQIYHSHPFMFPCYQDMIECIIPKKVYGYEGFKGSVYEKYFTDFISSKMGFAFDVWNNMFVQISECNIDIGLPKIKPLIDIRKKYVMISPFSGMEERIWNLENWANIADYVIEKYNYDVIITGGLYTDIQKVPTLMNLIKNKERCINTVGKIPLNIFPSLLHVVDLMIGAESGTVHIATNTENFTSPILCLSPGRSYIAFHPYSWDNNITYIYPDKVNEIIAKGDGQSLVKFTPCHINDILPETVKEKIDKVLNSVIVKN